MINSVQNISNVSFKATAMDKLTPEMISYPGKYSTQSVSVPNAEPSQDGPKKGSLLGTLAKLVVAALVLAGGAVVVRKNFFQTAISDLEKSEGFVAKSKYYFARVTDYIIEHTPGLKKAEQKASEESPKGGVPENKPAEKTPASSEAPAQAPAPADKPTEAGTTPPAAEKQVPVAPQTEQAPVDPTKVKS